MNKNGLYSNVRRTDSGFTLIELLVVIAIIAILISVVVPSLNRTREKTKQVICMAHLKDIGMGMHTYAIGNKEKFPDNYTLGGFSFRAAPGYIDPADKRGSPETFGLAAILGETDIIPSESKIWVCPAQPHEWMRKCGNTYAFSIAEILKTTKVPDLKRYSKTWLVWDNYTLMPYTPGVRSSGSEVGFSIATKDRLYPHNFSHNEDRKDNKSANVLYADSHAAPFYEQP
jgi:prepilin-type N-terminal cleavage/methylation domain-containing protein/prepilin-type processing-associated H-X9-DG protein